MSIQGYLYQQKMLSIRNRYSQTIALSGVSGFLGGNLYDYLINRDYPVTKLDLRTNPSPKLSDDIGVVVHMAGLAHDLENVNCPDKYFEVNTELTKKLFTTFLQSAAQNFIYISSVKAVADTLKRDALSEEDDPKPQTPYGKSKLAAEFYLNDQVLPEGKRVYILRPCMIHGPGNKGNLNLLYQIVSRGIPWPLGAFENRRSFLSVDNFCWVIEELLNGYVEPGTYNVSDSESLSTNEIVRLIAESNDRRVRILNLSPLLIRTIAKWGDTIRLPLTSERLKKLTEYYVVSNTKLLNAIGKPLPVSASKGLIKTIQSFKS